MLTDISFVAEINKRYKREQSLRFLRAYTCFAICSGIFAPPTRHKKRLSPTHAFQVKRLIPSHDLKTDGKRKTGRGSPTTIFISTLFPLLHRFVARPSPPSPSFLPCHAGGRAPTRAPNHHLPEPKVSLPNQEAPPMFLCVQPPPSSSHSSGYSLFYLQSQFGTVRPLAYNTPVLKKQYQNRMPFMAAM